MILRHTKTKMILLSVQGIDEPLTFLDKDDPLTFQDLDDSLTFQGIDDRVGMILPARVNPPHKTRVYPGWAIGSYYPLWAICGFYEFLVLKIFSVFSLMIDIKV